MVSVLIHIATNITASGKVGILKCPWHADIASDRVQLILCWLQTPPISVFSMLSDEVVEYYISFINKIKQNTTKRYYSVSTLACSLREHTSLPVLVTEAILHFWLHHEPLTCLTRFLLAEKMRVLSIMLRSPKTLQGSPMHLTWKYSETMIEHTNWIYYASMLKYTILY